MEKCKRQSREMDDVTKMRISQKLKGRSKTEDHKQAISNGLRNHWAQLPPKQP